MKTLEERLENTTLSNYTRLLKNWDRIDWSTDYSLVKTSHISPTTAKKLRESLNADGLIVGNKCLLKPAPIVTTKSLDHNDLVLNEATPRALLSTFLTHDPKDLKDLTFNAALDTVAPYSNRKFSLALALVVWSV